MNLLSQLTISRPEGNASIQLLQGDLSAIPPEFAVDILALSAFPGHYEPIVGTLIGSFYEAGLSIGDLANNRELDFPQLSCWLSSPLSTAQQARFQFSKVLCFEPRGQVDDADTEVGNLFRGINTFAIDKQYNDLAMPVLSTGNRQFPIEAMLPALLDTAIFWFENGLPLKSLKLVLFRDEQVMKGLPIFENVSKRYALKKAAETNQIPASQALTDIDSLNQEPTGDFALPKMTFALQEMNKAETEESLTYESTRDLDFSDLTGRKPGQYDFFISYSHKDTNAVQEFVSVLQAQHPQLSIFYDRTSIPPGGLWIKLISDAIQNSKNVVCILTPDYTSSTVCWDEFQCAYIMEQRKKLQLQTINFHQDDNLPPIMAIRSYIDCTEGDIDKLKGAVSQLVK
ncbi:toll/interleukin-1 receptor domain-containing protein [Spirosoma aerophilum]